MTDVYLDQFIEIEKINTLKTELIEKQARWTEDEQKLSIGVMGQVKAGKSSFLNALLFDGKPILPEAATPKTANLTKISYGEKFTLKVDYYSQEEWQEIKKLAVMDAQSIECKVAKELVDMVKKVGDDEINRCLSMQSEVIAAENLDGLQGILNQYTGNDGSHTSLVKSTEITLPVDELKGFEVVDTPGMNDPVASRTQKTREYMASCDVVFFLSRCSQFLDKADDDLLRDQLPNKGVKRLVVVAGQFDSAILDDGYDRDSLQETINNLKMRQTRQAKKKADEIAENKVALNDQQKEMVVDSLSNPVFSSTFAQGFAHWPKSKWSKAMLHVHNELTELAEDEWDTEFSQQDWLKIANFDALQQAFSQAKADSHALLEAQKRSYLPDAYNAMLTQYTSLMTSIQQRIEFIQTKDVADIEKEQQGCEHKAASIASSLAYTLTQAKNEAKQSASELVTQLKQDQVSFSQLSTRTGTYEEEVPCTVSTSRWYNPLSWGSSETYYRTRTVSYDYLSAHDAIEQVNQYGAESAKQIVAIFGKLIAPSAIKLRLKQALLNELDTRSEEFDPMVFKAMLENFIAKLDLPIFDVQMGDTTSLISNSFSGEVTSSSAMDELRSKLNQALSLVLERLQQEFEKQFNAVVSKLDNAGEGLSNELTEDLQQELAKVKQQILDKENEVIRFNAYLNDVELQRNDILEKQGALI